MGDIRHETVIDAARERVWAVLSDFGNAQAWSPLVTHSAIVGDQERCVGCERSCDVPGFGALTERATDWVEGERITIEGVGLPMMRRFASTWELEGAGEATRVRASIDYEPRFGLLGRVLARLVMQRRISGGLRQAVAGLKHYVETGEPVGVEAPQASAA